MVLVPLCLSAIHNLSQISTAYQQLNTAFSMASCSPSCHLYLPTLKIEVCMCVCVGMYIYTHMHMHTHTHTHTQTHTNVCMCVYAHAYECCVCLRINQSVCVPLCVGRLTDRETDIFLKQNPHISSHNLGFKRKETEFSHTEYAFPFVKLN